MKRAKRLHRKERIAQERIRAGWEIASSKGVTFNGEVGKLEDVRFYLGDPWLGDPLTPEEEAACEAADTDTNLLPW